MPVILDWRDAGAWMAEDDPGALLRAPPEDALREWIVSPRVNRSGIGDDDPALIGLQDWALRRPLSARSRLSATATAPKAYSRHKF
jgi:hypothetical protein